MDSAVPVNHRVKIKENEKRDLARVLKKLCDVKVAVLTIVIGALRIILKGLIKGLEDLEIRGQMVTILTTTLS